MPKLFSYIDYDRISDDLYYIGGVGKFILRMNVSLARKTEDGTRRHFYNEYVYDSKYNDKGQVVSMRRSYDYYMTLESLEDRGNGVMIRPQDMILLRSKLTEVSQWFNSDVFTVRKNKLMVNRKVNPVVIDGFPDRKSISFEPIVIDWEDGNQSMGLRITLYGSIFTDISIDRFYGFLYTINCINMIQCAQLMLAYMGMPEYGTNRYEVDTGYFSAREENTNVPQGVVKERKLKTKKQSYFDKIDKLGGN